MKKYQLTTAGFKKVRAFKVTQMRKPIDISDATLYTAVQGKIFFDRALTVLLANIPDLHKETDYVEIEQPKKPEKVIKKTKPGKQPKYVILPQGVTFIGEIGRSMDFIARNCGFSLLILMNFVKSLEFKHYSITKRMLQLFQKRYKGFEEGIHYVQVSKEND